MDVYPKTMFYTLITIVLTTIIELAKEEHVVATSPSFSVIRNTENDGNSSCYIAKNALTSVRVMHNNPKPDPLQQTQQYQVLAG